jgi:hypothetical protein
LAGFWLAFGYCYLEGMKEMAFGGYCVVRSNVFDSSVRDEITVFEDEEVDAIIDEFKSQAHGGDYLAVFEEDTEYDGTLIFDLFNDPSSGWCRLGC